jgi:AraC-like DNA-binding protein
MTGRVDDSTDNEWPIVGRANGASRVRAAATSGLCDIIRDNGAEPDRLLSHADLTADDLAEPMSWLFLADYCRLLERSADALGLPLFGLDCGLRNSKAILGELGELAASAPTLRAALETLSRYFATLQEQSTLRFERYGAFFMVTYQIRDGRIVRRRQDAELSLGVLVGFMRAALGPNWTPLEVHFEHPQPSSRNGYDALLGAPVYFGQCRNAVVVSPTDVGAVLQTSNPTRLADLERRIGRRLPDSQNEDFVSVVLQEIRDGLIKGDPGIAAAARRLDLSPSALYRRLRHCGAEFSELQRDLRREIALMHVGETHIPLTEVASMLGYSELSAFSRAFRSWTGLPAIVYRRQRHDLRAPTPRRIHGDAEAIFE